MEIFFRTTWDLDSQKEVSNHQQSVREFTTWELFGVGPPPTSLPLSVRLAEDWMCLGGKNSIGNHGFYSCVHSWKMCEKWVCNHAIRYLYVWFGCVWNGHARRPFEKGNDDKSMDGMGYPIFRQTHIELRDIHFWNHSGQHMGMGPGVYGCSSQHQKKGVHRCWSIPT